MVYCYTVLLVEVLDIDNLAEIFIVITVIIV